jgi:anhydro-N-acetylmuramic acid kinase
MKKDFQQLFRKKKMRLAGLMSGTSADGVDVAIIDFDGKKVRQIAFGQFSYSPSFRKKIFNLFRPDSGRVDEICRMNFEIGELFADSLIKLSKKAGIKLDTIDLIGSHGQTIYHIPQQPRSTLQIGEPSVIAERTGIATVADFRPRDITAGGQGAPLVPYADFILFQDKRKTRALQNIGGIANVTFLPAGGTAGDILAFDTGPGNMIMDRVTYLVTKGGKTYDNAGKLAAKGKINSELLNQLMTHPYLGRRPPKTTGREDFGLQFSDALYANGRRKRIDPLDILATVTAFTAKTIAQAYIRFLPRKVDEMILCGGGSWNKTLLNMLQAELPGTQLRLMNEFGLNPDAKEAVSFAILAYATIHGMPNNVPSATGAKRPVVLGKIVPT